jgi:hypothetical protein
MTPTYGMSARTSPRRRVTDPLDMPQYRDEPAPGHTVSGLPEEGPVALADGAPTGPRSSPFEQGPPDTVVSPPVQYG